MSLKQILILIFCILFDFEFGFFCCEFRIRIRPRFLIDVSKRDLSCNVLGTNLDYPIAIAPTAMQKMAHPEGEKATAKGILYNISSINTLISNNFDVFFLLSLNCFIMDN